jgi:DNA-binding response OmpR family regulator
VAEAWRKAAGRVSPILVVADDRITASRISEMMRGLGPVGDVQWSGGAAEAWRYLEAMHPQLLFIEQAGRNVDGLALTQRLRLSSLAVRETPVVMISEEKTVAAMRAAQNAGADEFLIRPFSAADLDRRLEAICAPRTWVEGQTYVGPDRRRFNAAAAGPERRRRP